MEDLVLESYDPTPASLLSRPPRFFPLEDMDDDDGPPPLPPSDESTPTESPSESPLPSPPHSPRQYYSGRTPVEMDEKKKSKLKQLLGSDFEVLRDLESLDIKKKEKIQKLLGINVDALEENSKNPAERKKSRKSRNRLSLFLKEQRDALNIPEIPSEYDSSAAPTIPFSEGQFIRIADFKPEPELDQVAQDYFDGKLDDAEIKSKYSVSFGIRRGGCTPPCECTQYLGLNGSPCSVCGHFPAKHFSLGKVDEPNVPSNPSSSIMMDTSSGSPNLADQVELIKRVRSTTTHENATKVVFQSPKEAQRKVQRLRSMTVEGTSPSGVNDIIRVRTTTRTEPQRIPNSSSPSSSDPLAISPTANLNNPLLMPNEVENEEGEVQRKSSIGFDALKSSPWLIDGSELQFVSRLGVGTSAKVYRGKYRNQEVAIKVLLSLPEAKHVEDFKREFEIMSSLRSTNVVYFYGAVIEPKICMVLEFCSRGSLYDVLKDESNVVDWPKVIKIITDAVKGVSCLHNWKPQIVHRDLKSLNLLIDENWTCKVADFGLSRFLVDHQQSTLGKLRGTYAYCAPEVYYGKAFNASSDIYSIAIILWELVSRCIKGVYERPFSEYTFISFDFQISARNNLRPTIPASCPVPMADIIRACWDAESLKRPTCEQLLSQMADLQKLYDKDSKKWNEGRKKRS